MNWIFPIAGKGSRVKSLGSFKPFIKIKNKTIIEYFLYNLKKKIKKNDKLHFITTHEYEKKYKVELVIKKILRKIKCPCKVNNTIIKGTTNGPGITVHRVLTKLKNNEPCIIINPDQVVDFYLPKKINSNKVYIPIHFNTHGKSSYVDINRKGKIIRILEKKLITYYASSGVYIFGSVKNLKKIYKKYNFKKSKSEVNLSNIINNYLKYNKKNVEPLETFFKYDLGNIASLKYFENIIESKN
ncbi:sugar phosphate nucleotidyltransferase [Candidatus Pelagibacter communis]|mgnify:CR=1 FL=1|uniref:sugar phosphate nucleotidyltransferase n=1 Tax=Pelagibacter ubique TaxID=198252 RepID=UPI00094C8D15|nr:sugar phosphate nucleotidyltransferase [Candidatus Pelagibacter ubique]